MLYVVRHGQSVWNAENRFTGWKDVPLSEAGINEAKNVGELMKNMDIHIDYMFTSNLERAKDTGRIISSYLGVIPSKSCELLNERNYGVYSGLNKNDVKNDKGPEYLHKLRRSYTYKPIDGESLDDVVKRVGVFMNNIYTDTDYSNDSSNDSSNDNQNILISAHGNSLRALFVHLGIKNKENIESFEIPTGQLIQIDLETKEYKYLNPFRFHGRQILDSRGNPTVEVICKNSNSKTIGRGSTPSGASCGSKEAYEMRDGNTKFNGKSVMKAIDNINLINNTMGLKESNMLNLRNIDGQIVQIDGTKNKELLGGNTTTAVSFCALDAISKLRDIEKFEYIQEMTNNTNLLFIPTPLANVLNGGKHGSGGLQIQEFMIFIHEEYDINRQVEILHDIFFSLKKCLSAKYGKSSTNLGDEGGYVPCGMKTNYEALDILMEAIISSGHSPNKDVFVALDCAASEFYESDNALYEIEENVKLTGEELRNYYGTMIQKYPFIKSIEDPFDEEDYVNWSEFTRSHGNTINIVGDDLFCTNKELVEMGLNHGWANSLLLKVNQIGTVTESIESAQLMLKENKKVIVSHRSGETNHSYIIDMAVGMGAQYVKIGGLCRGERIEKYNRLLEINDIISS